MPPAVKSIISGIGIPVLFFCWTAFVIWFFINIALFMMKNRERWDAATPDVKGMVIQSMFNQLAYVMFATAMLYISAMLTQS